MDASAKATAQRALDAVADGSMDFPQIVGALIGAGFESYHVDFLRGTATYYLAGGGNIELAMHRLSTPVAPRFDAQLVRVAVGEAQRKAPGYSYAGFCEKTAAAGCAGYIVSFTGRRVVYFGRTAETHVELFPN